LRISRIKKPDFQENLASFFNCRAIEPSFAKDAAMAQIRKHTPPIKHSPQSHIPHSAQIVSRVRRVTWIGMVTNILLAILKFVAGFLGSSQAVVADAVHSLSDMTTDLAILLGVKYWSAPADEEHPYGHGRIETIVTILIGATLAVVAFGMSYEALTTIQSNKLQQPGWIALYGAVLSILMKEILYRWTVGVGKRENSSAVIANAWHHRSDALSSIPVVVTVVIATINPKWSFVDRIGVFLVSLFILNASWRIIKPALNVLADAGASSEVQNQIRSLVMRIREVKSVHAIRTRFIGPGIFADLHILVDGKMTVREGHDVSETVKQQLLHYGPDVMDVVVHLEPYDKGRKDGSDEIRQSG
jgi:cation diffusion facilitator family transporter